MCCVDDSATDADEFFQALTHVREQVEAAFAEVTAGEDNSQPVGEKAERSGGPRDGSRFVTVYLAMASRDEWME